MRGRQDRTCRSKELRVKLRALLPYIRHHALAEGAAFPPQHAWSTSQKEWNVVHADGRIGSARSGRWNVLPEFSGEEFKGDRPND